MSLRRVLLLLVWSVWLAAAADEGDLLAPVMMSDQDHDDRFSAGDLVYCGGQMLRLQGQGPWSFYRPEEDPGALACVTATGPVVVGRFLGLVGEGMGLEELDRLAETPLTASEVAGWWGVTLVPNLPMMPPDLLPMLSPEALVWIREGAYALLPKLPSTTRHLWLSDVVEGRDVHLLSRFPGLTTLRLDNLYDESDIGDAPAVVEVPALAALQWNGPSLKAQALISTWSTLRTITIRSESWQDLGPIARLPALERLCADGCSMAAAPTTVGPALRELSMIGAAVDTAAAQRLSQAHPKLRLTWLYQQALRRALGTAAGMHITEMKNGERKVAETYVGSASEAAVLATMIEVNEGIPGPCCFCGDGALITLVRGDLLPMEISIHQSIGIGWSNGAWPGNAWLTLESGQAIALWLRERGMPFAWNELERARQARELRLARAASVAAMLPGAAATAAQVLSDDPAAIVKRLPPQSDRELRANILLTLVGLNDDPLDFRRHLRDTLFAQSGESMAAVLRGEASSEVLAGAAWWFLDQGHLKDLPGGNTHDVIDAAVVALLAQEPPVRVVVAATAVRATPGALPALRRLVLAHPAAAAPSPTLADPTALQSANERLLEKVSLPALAALGIARLGAVECLPDLEARIYSDANQGNDSRAWYLASAALRALSEP